MLRIRKNDTVMIIKGKDNGKTGRVMKILPGVGKAIVEGRNFVKKHAHKTQKNPQGGIIQIESPIALSNIMPVCPKCSKPSVKRKGNALWECKSCGARIAGGTYQLSTPTGEVNRRVLSGMKK